MKRWAKLSLATVVGGGLGVGLAAWLGSVRWRRKTCAMAKELTLPVLPDACERVSFADFERLPIPVARYLRLALKEGQPLIRSVRIRQCGELRGFDKPQVGWMPFEAVQIVSPQAPGFVWDAAVRPAPWLRMRVRDAYVAGQGAAQVAALSLAPLANEHGKPELSAGALMRFLAEAVWFPTALLPTTRLAWSPISNSKALVTLTDAATTVSLEFDFNQAGEVTRVSTPGRYRAVGGGYELTPWEGRHRNYQKRNGMWIPTVGEVAWRLPDGARPVWRGRIVDVAYDCCAYDCCAYDCCAYDCCDGADRRSHPGETHATDAPC